MQIRGPTTTWIGQSGFFIIYLNHYWALSFCFVLFCCFFDYIKSHLRYKDIAEINYYSYDTGILYICSRLIYWKYNQKPCTYFLYVKIAFCNSQYIAKHYMYLKLHYATVHYITNLTLIFLLFSFIIIVYYYYFAMVAYTKNYLPYIEYCTE